MFDRSFKRRDTLHSLPLYQIDRAGQGSLVATLDPIAPQGCALRFHAPLLWPTDDDMRDGWFAGVPYFMDDMRPQGFLGRQFARHYATLFQVSEDPKNWHEDDALYVLSAIGGDTPGNYVLGDTAYRQHLETVQRGYPVITDGDIAEAYPAHALQAMSGGEISTLISGQFPKFTACRETAGSKYHVLVKFSGNDGTAGVQRWADLLVCEHLALNVIATHLEFAAASSAIVQSQERTFLEVRRFDRHGEFGRSAVCTWAALESAFFGMAGASWISAAQRLIQAGFISAEIQRQIEVLWHFGKLIANTDMHEGNLAFVPSDSRDTPGQITMSPAYDMLPMLYAPVRGVELPQRDFVPALPLPGEQASWRQAAAAATAFWQLAAEDVRISTDFRAICAGNAETIARLL